MSQYGNQQYGQGAQDQSQQDPSAGGYSQEHTTGYGQDQNAQQDPSAGGYGQEDTTGYGQDQNAQQDPSAGAYGQEVPSQAGGDPSAYGQQNLNSQKNGYGAVATNQQNANGAMTQGQQRRQGQQGRQGRQAVSAKHAHYTPEHHNAVHHAGQAAKKGFTSQHMDAIIKLGMYGLGTLANTHGLAPEAPHPGDAEEEYIQ